MGTAGYEEKMKLYMAVTADRLELPVIVADSPVELARRFHTTPDIILTAIRRQTVRRGEHVRFIRVDVDDWDYTIG